MYIECLNEILQDCVYVGNSRYDMFTHYVVNKLVMNINVIVDLRMRVRHHLILSVTVLLLKFKKTCPNLPNYII